MRQVIVAAAVTAAIAIAMPAWANDVGQVKTAKGTVHVERDGKRLPASVGMPIRQADTLVTGEDGAVGVTFIDNSLLSTARTACWWWTITTSIPRRTPAASTPR